jgi:PAS domain S-box-containing protein
MASVEPADLECIRGDMEAIAAGKKDSHVWEYRVRREDGSARWIQSRGKVAGRDASGTPVHVSGSITDIHDRKVAEGALRQSEERFRRLFHEHSAVKLIVDPATGQICDANKAAVAFYGWPLDELKAMRMQQINTLPPGQLASALESARDGRQTQFEFRHRRADGSERDVEVFSNVIELDGRAQVYSIVHDVTERRLAEEEKERVAAENRQLLKAESLGRMAAAIAHHFNNQLQSVLAHLELAMEDPSDEPRGREDLQAAAAAARKAAELSRLMRTYMGHDLGDRRPADLSDACVQALAAVGSRADAGASLHVDLQSPGPCVFANPRQLEQLVDHLVTNGLEALRGGPREILVSVATLSAADIPHARRFPVDFRPEGGAYACLEVADSGRGVPEQDLERIFDPFFSTKLLGRGLGLAVVIGIVRSLQGAVVVAPRPQGGTSFRVFLPVLASEVAHAQAPRRAGSMAPNPVTADVFGRYLEALCAGDRAACHQTVTALLERGVTGRTLGGDLFRASLQEVGVRWERGLIDVATEHRATAITEELLAVAFPSAGARARNGRRALVSCAANERHQLGGRIVSLVMEQRGWDVSFLGANGSIDALVALVASVRPGLVGLSLSVASHLDEALRSVEAVRAAGHAMPIVLGGEAVYGLAPGRLAGWADVHAIPTLEEFEERLPTWERG